MHSFGALFLTYRDAWLAACLVAIGCSLVAVYVVLRRVAFLGMAISQIAAAGVAIAFVVNGPPLLLAAIATAIGVFVFSFGREPVRVSREALVGVAFAVASAAGVLFVFRSSQELDHIEHIVYGSLLYVTIDQVWWLAAGTGAVVLLHSLFHREFTLVAMDPDTARTLGVRTRLFQSLLAATIGIMITLSIGAAGSLLTFSLLVFPALTALLLADRMAHVLLCSLASGLAATAGGLTIAILFDLPPGPTIVVAAATLLGSAALERVRRWLGLAALLLLVLAIAIVNTNQLTHDHLVIPAPAASSESTTLRVEVEVTTPSRVVTAGERVRVEFHGHVHGEPRGELHVLLELGATMATARLPLDASHVVLDLDTLGLVSGHYPILVSLWTGPPLDPNDATRLLDSNECTVTAPIVEIR